MNFWQNVLAFLDTQMTRPESYGWFHILFLILSIGFGVLLCLLYKHGHIKNVKRVLLYVSIVVIVLEIYKMINYTFSYEDGIKADFQWYAFPWQFCSTPMYVGLLAGLTRGKLHDSLCSYLATFALFAGVAVMVYPNDVFIGTVGINIQSMICHGSMISIAIFLFYTNHVQTKLKTLLYAIPVFATTVSIAAILNEVIYYSGVLDAQSETFNMFYISRHFDSTLPVYSIVHNSVPFPINLIIYIIGFAAASGVMLLIAAGIKALAGKITSKASKADANS